MERVIPSDKFIVINKSILNDSDRKILFMLYQPIIGQSSISLYFSLWAYLDQNDITSSDWTHLHLINNTQMDLDEIINSREKLEGIGLLKTYVKRGITNEYVYELYSPLSVYEFLNNPVLNISLYNSVGETEFERIVSYFKIPTINLDEYEDITSSFNDIFMSIDFDSYRPILGDLRENKKNKLKILSSFNLENTISLIPEELLDTKYVTNEIKDFLYKLSFIYNYNDSEMLELIKNSIIDKKISKELLKENARKYYKFENPDKVVGIVYKKQPERLRKEYGNSKKDKIIYQFETMSPYEFICNKHGGDKPTKHEINILEYLLDDMNLNPGVVNVIIDYVLKISNNKLNKNFVDAVATQFSRSKIETVEDAMDLANQEYKNRNKTKTTKKVKVLESVPEWAKQENDMKQGSAEDIKKMEEMLSKFE